MLEKFNAALLTLFWREEVALDAIRSEGHVDRRGNNAVETEEFARLFVLPNEIKGRLIRGACWNEFDGVFGRFDSEHEVTADTSWNKFTREERLDDSLETNQLQDRERPRPFGALFALPEKV